MHDYAANSHHQMPQPMPGMSVYASYEAFGAEKLAELLAALKHTFNAGDSASRALITPVHEAKTLYSRIQGEQTEHEPHTARTLREMVGAGKEVADSVKNHPFVRGYYRKGEEKVAEQPPRFDVLTPTHNAFAVEFGKALANKFVTDPIDGIHRILKKKIVEDPKAMSTFYGVIESDPELQRHYSENPDQVHDTFKALRRFGPSMAASPAVVRSFLRQSMMAGGNMDFATIRMLAETEKFIQNSRGQGK